MKKASRGRACRHENRTPLGVDDTAYFYRCDACGEVLIAQGGKVWRLEEGPIPT